MAAGADVRIGSGRRVTLAIMDDVSSFLFYCCLLLVCFFLLLLSWLMLVVVVVVVVVAAVVVLAVGVVSAYFLGGKRQIRMLRLQLETFVFHHFYRKHFWLILSIISLFFHLLPLRTTPPWPAPSA